MKWLSNWSDRMPATKGDIRMVMEAIQKMTQAIASFQTQMNTLATQLGSEFDQIATEEAALKQQIADLQAKQTAGTFGPDDQAALDAVEQQYAALVAKAQAFVPPPPASGTTA